MKQWSAGFSFLVLAACCAAAPPAPKPTPFPDGAFEWSAEAGRVNEPFTADLRPRKSIVVPYRIESCRLDEGDLPPGLRQDGEHVEGIPQTAGEWTTVFRVQLSVGREERRVIQYVPWKVAIAPAEAVQPQAAPKVQAKTEVRIKCECGRAKVQAAVLKELREVRKLVKELKKIVSRLKKCRR